QADGDGRFDNAVGNDIVCQVAYQRPGGQVAVGTSAGRRRWLKSAERVNAGADRIDLRRAVAALKLKPQVRGELIANPGEPSPRVLQIGPDRRARQVVGRVEADRPRGVPAEIEGAGPPRVLRRGARCGEHRSQGGSRQESWLH